MLMQPWLVLCRGNAGWQCGASGGAHRPLRSPPALLPLVRRRSSPPGRLCIGCGHLARPHRPTKRGVSPILVPVWWSMSHYMKVAQLLSRAAHAPSSFNNSCAVGAESYSVASSDIVLHIRLLFVPPRMAGAISSPMHRLLSAFPIPPL
jgi:hypothetical protein